MRKLAPEIPWSNIIGMRNILVHGYFDIDTDPRWNDSWQHWRNKTNDTFLSRPFLFNIKIMLVAETDEA